MVTIPYSNFDWKILWNLPLPNKVLLFLWKLVNNFLPISTLLKSRNIQVPTICTFYDKEEETLSDLFLHCSFTIAHWFGFVLFIRSKRIIPQDVIEWIRGYFEDSKIYPHLNLNLICPTVIILCYLVLPKSS